MLCPVCRTGCAADDIFCRRCGVDLSIPSKSLVPVETQVPAQLLPPQVPRLAVGVGAVAVGVGLELLRRGLLARLARPASAPTTLLSTLLPSRVGEPVRHVRKRRRAGRGYEVQETMIYMSRVIRREE
jgi:hypothetical protein